MSEAEELAKAKALGERFAKQATDPGRIRVGRSAVVGLAYVVTFFILIGVGIGLLLGRAIWHP